MKPEPAPKKTGTDLELGDDIDPVIAQRSANLERLKEILIKSIENKKQHAMQKSLNLGIKGIEHVIKGGIRAGTTICLNGSTGSGMTIFGLKFLYHGITKEDENGIYISFDESKDSILSTANVFGMDFYRLEKERKFIFIEYPYNEIPQFDEKNSVIGDFIRTVGAKRLVIDPITPLTLGYENELVKRKKLKNLFERLKTWGCTTMLLAEGMSDEQTSRDGVSKLSDGFFQFYFKKIKGKRVRGFEVPKMRGTPHSYDTYEFVINSEHGIEILKKKLLI